MKYMRPTRKTKPQEKTESVPEMMLPAWSMMIFVFSMICWKETPREKRPKLKLPSK